LQEFVDGYGMLLQTSSNSLLVVINNISKYLNVDYHGCDKLTCRFFLLLSLCGSACNSSACPHASNTTAVTKSDELWYRVALLKLFLITLIPSTFSQQMFHKMTSIT